LSSSAPRTLALAVLALLVAGPARAHHGVAAVGVGGPEGPGAALETTSPLPLPARTLFVMTKSEYVPFQRRAIAEPENKRFSSFNLLAAGYGVTPWLSAYLFQPLNAKAQDGIGTNVGLGDPNLMLALGFKYDDGLRLVPEKESLDDLLDWHFSLWASSTIPVGPTTHRDRSGAYYEPDMQTGFGAPSPAVGVAALKQLTERLTWLGEASYQHFFAHDYPFTRYQFGGETRANTALVYELYGAGSLRLDVAGELSGLHVQRDRERSGAGAMERLPASGGAILYAGAGVRVYRGNLGLALGLKRAALMDLNEARDQQGSEGLEQVRAALTLSWSKAL
jgi:hypothetical protein